MIDLLRLVQEACTPRGPSSAKNRGRSRRADVRRQRAAALRGSAAPRDLGAAAAGRRPEEGEDDDDEHEEMEYEEEEEEGAVSQVGGGRTASGVCRESHTADRLTIELQRLGRAQGAAAARTRRARTKARPSVETVAGRSSAAKGGAGVAAAADERRAGEQERVARRRART